MQHGIHSELWAMAVFSFQSCSSAPPCFAFISRAYLTRSAPGRTTFRSSVPSLDNKGLVLLERQDDLQVSHEACNFNLQRTWKSAVTSKQGELSARSNSFGIFPYSKASPFLFLAGVSNQSSTECLRGKLFVRDQVLLGYWIGPEQGDGWGFVEAYLVPS